MPIHDNSPTGVTFETINTEGHQGNGTQNYTQKLELKQKLIYKNLVPTATVFTSPFSVWHRNTVGLIKFYLKFKNSSQLQ